MQRIPNRESLAIYGKDGLNSPNKSLISGLISGGSFSIFTQIPISKTFWGGEK